MSSRGRPNTASSKTKSKPVVKSTSPALAKAKGKTKLDVLASAYDIGKTIVSGNNPNTKNRKGVHLGHHRLTAKILLKRAYEKRAKRQIRFGNLGQARRTLRKKITVV